jgi:hypothetical protein
MEIRLPEDKLVKLKDKFAYIANRKKLTLGELLSLIGFLKFACAVVTPGRAYLMRIIDLTIGLKKNTVPQLIAPYFNGNYNREKFLQSNVITLPIIVPSNSKPLSSKNIPKT